jgi:hypothetical protein
MGAIDKHEERGKKDIGFRDAEKNEKPAIVSDDQGANDPRGNRSSNNDSTN